MVEYVGHQFGRDPRSVLRPRAMRRTNRGVRRAAQGVEGELHLLARCGSRAGCGRERDRACLRQECQAPGAGRFFFTAPASPDG